MHLHTATLRSILQRSRRQLLRDALLHGALHGIWLGLLIALLVGALSRFWWSIPLVKPEQVAGVGLLVAPLLSGLWAYSRFAWTDSEVAFLTDQLLKTDERLITALYLEREGHEMGRTLSDLPHDLEASLYRAIKRPLPTHSRWLLLVSALVLAVFFIPPSSNAQWVPPNPTEVQAEANRLAQSLSEGELLPRSIQDTMDQLVEEMKKDTIDSKAAQEQLDALDHTLNTFSDQQRQSKKALNELKSAAKELSEVSTLNALANAIGRADMDLASRASQQLAAQSTQWSPDETERIADALKRAAQRLQQPENQGVADALKSAGEELASGGRSQSGSNGKGGQSQHRPNEAGSQDGQNGQSGGGEQSQNSGGEQSGQHNQSDQQGLQTLADELRRNEALAERLKDGERALQQAEQNSSALRAARERLSANSATGQNPQSTPSQQNTPDPQRAPGLAHTWEDQSERTGKVNAGQNAPNERFSQRTADQAIDDFEMLYRSLRVDDVNGQLTAVNGTRDNNGQIDVFKTTRTGGSEQASTPLLVLPTRYKDAAEEAISDERVPPGYRDAVKTYFDGLE